VDIDSVDFVTTNGLRAIGGPGGLAGIIIACIVFGAAAATLGVLAARGSRAPPPHKIQTYVEGGGSPAKKPDAGASPAAEC
jgi:hypothetical protein